MGWGNVQMIINGSKLIKAEPIVDMLTGKHIAHGVSHGLSQGGYDIRIAEDVFFGEQGVCVDGEWKQGRFTLASAMEQFDMPFDLIGVVCDKSSWARQGLAVFSTVIESGWRGWLTLELIYHGINPLHIKAGSGIAQVVFHQLAEPASYGNGKYQDQPRGAVEAKFERDL
jgi:dCTP deaminase